MMVYRMLLTVCLAVIFHSCATTPVLNQKGDISRRISQKAPYVSKIDISPDERYALSGSHDAFILWDIRQGEKIETFRHAGFMDRPIAVAFSPDGKYFASAGRGTKLWDLSTRREIMTLDDAVALSMAFSPDGKYLLCGRYEVNLNPFAKDKDSRIKIYEVATGKEIKGFIIPKPDGCYSVAYSPDGQYFLSGDTRGEMKLWNIATGACIKTVKASGGFKAIVRAVAFSPDGRQVLSGGIDNSVILWNATNLSRSKTFVTQDGHAGALSGLNSVAFSPEGRYAMSAGDDGKIIIWDITTGAEWKRLRGHTGLYGTAAKFFANGQYVISAGDASTRIWNVTTGEELASMIAFDDGEWIVMTSNGYYNCSPEGDRYFQVNVGDKAYSIDQLRESFYRPDLVKVALSGGSLRELKNVADIKPPPIVEIVDARLTGDRSVAAVGLKITDGGGGVGDIRLYLNGSAVKLDSARGIKVADSRQNVIYKTYELKLSPGRNTIRAIAFNGENSMQSAEALKEITATYQSVGSPTLYALVIGINAYKNPKLQLNYAVADAALFADTLKAVAAPLFDKVEIKTLSAKAETTRENILNEFRLMQSLNPDDLFVLYVASHGTVDDGEYFLITSNVGSTRTERLKTDAISQSLFKELIGNIPATKKLIIIDTCNAGALGEAIQATLLTRGMSEDTAMKILSRAVGSTILSASTSMQEALEGYQGHGLFTYVLAEGLKGKADKGNTGYVKTTELADYVDTEVPVMAEGIFKRAQYPIISISGQAFPIGKVR